MIKLYSLCMSCLCFSFGLLPGAQLHVPNPLPPNQSPDTPLLLSTSIPPPPPPIYDNFPLNQLLLPANSLNLIFSNFIILSFLDGPIQRMDPLTNIQVAIKNSIDVFYFSALVPFHVLFIEDGQMGTSLQYS